MNIICRKVKIFFLERKIRKYQRLFKQLYLLHIRKNSNFEAIQYANEAFGWLYGSDYSDLIQPLYDQHYLLKFSDDPASKKKSLDKGDTCEHQT